MREEGEEVDDDDAGHCTGSVDDDAAAACSASPDVDLFRLAEKRYRYQSPPTQPHTNRRGRRYQQRQQCTQLDDFSDVIDLHRLELNSADLQQRVQPRGRDDGAADALSGAARVFSIRDCDGLIVITHALSEEQQLQWAHRCLSDYSNAAHTNLSNLHGPQPDHWRHVVASGDWSTFNALRWASLGYHYDWTARSYTATKHSPFPPALAELSATLAAAVQLPLRPSAAIVNYYPLSSMMLAHVDDAELTRTPPIVSISIGQSAIFLIGGHTKAAPPTALWLHSGDVLVMGGESRRCYHGVPRIMGGTQWDGVQWSSDTAQHEMGSVQAYLNAHRININVRQVEDEQHTFINMRAKQLMIKSRQDV